MKRHFYFCRPNLFCFRANAEADYMERVLIEKSKVVGSIPTICESKYSSVKNRRFPFVAQTFFCGL
jgi:hypothetical protein